ncbi:MAG: hypothetical protein MRY63_03825 [Neomegalonema sp.]|nr:hypothetical protein [Neomegalonema sp.]
MVRLAKRKHSHSLTFAGQIAAVSRHSAALETQFRAADPLKSAAKAMKPEILTTLPNYTRSDLQADVLAGVTVAMVALPLSLAIAIASGAPQKRSPTQVPGQYRMLSSKRRRRGTAWRNDGRCPRIPHHTSSTFTTNSTRYNRLFADCDCIFVL